MKIKRIIKNPIFTEKSFQIANNGKYTFEVNINATKREIARSVKEAFKVDVIDVKTQRIKGKRVRIRGTRLTKPKSKFKKAVVELVSGQKISVFETG